MTSQVRGLNQAVRNANDAISMIKVAEGATQAVSDSNTDSDRTALRAEVNQLVEEIGRISDNTQWNGTQLLDGSTYATPAHFQIGSNSNQPIAVEMANLSHTSTKSVFGNNLSNIATDIGIKTNVVGNLVTHGTADVPIDRDVWTTIESGLDFSADAANTYDLQSASFSPFGHRAIYHQQTLTNTLGAASGIFELDSTIVTGNIKAAYVVYIENGVNNKSLQVEFRLNDGDLEFRTTNARFTPHSHVDYSVSGQDPVATYNGLNLNPNIYT
jgi:flagellin-like hook-associated protein FlgL